MEGSSVVVSLAMTIALVATGAAPATDPTVRITVLYDNWVGVEGTEADWGFAALVERGDSTVLFDTGKDDWVLRHNLRALDVDLSSVDAVVLSHEHTDHTGGLFTVLGSTQALTVYVPGSFSPGFIDEVGRAGAEVVVAPDPVTVAPGIATSGTLGDEIPEQGLVVDVGSDLLLLTGCAHPGVVEMVRAVGAARGEPVGAVLGGFHLMRHRPDQVAAVMDALESAGVRRTVASHCTGEAATDQFREKFGERFVEMGTGRVVELGGSSAGGPS